jgi:hypothetical protein
MRAMCLEFFFFLLNSKQETDKMKLYLNLFLCLTNYHAMKTYWGSGGIASRILIVGTR